MSKKHDDGGTVPRERGRAFRGLLAAGVSVALLGAGISTATASASPANPSAAAKPAAAAEKATKAVGITYEGGPGHPGPVWAGTWDNGTRGFCIDFELHTPSSTGTTKLTGSIPGMSAKQSSRIKAITNAYSTTTSSKKAALAQLAIWTVEADSNFAKWYKASEVTKADRKAVKALVADADRGPFKVGVSTSKVEVGQDGTGTVKLVGGDPGGVKLSVALTATGAKIRTVDGAKGTKGTLDSGGLKFTYERTAPGKIDVQAVLTTPSPKIAGLSVTQKDHQRTLSGGFVETAIASYAYQLTPGKPTISSKCNTDCNGVASLSFSVCNPAGADAVTWTQKAGSDVVATLSAAGGKCVKKSAKVSDGQKIAASYCYSQSVGSACVTDTVKVPGTYEVVCPVWVKATYVMSCECVGVEGSSVTFLAPAASARFYRGFVTMTKDGKSTVKQVDLDNGSATKVDLGKLKNVQVAATFAAHTDAARKNAIGSKHTLFSVKVA